MKRIAVLIITIAFIKTTFADTVAVEFGTKNWPAVPILLTNAEPDLCKVILNGAKDAFASVSPDSDITTSTLKRLKPLSWTPAFKDQEDATSSVIGRIDLDLDGNGRKQVVIYRSVTHSWRGEWHYAYVFPSVEAFNAVSGKVKEDWIRLPEDSQYPDVTKLYLGARQYFPSAISNVNDKLQTGDVWADHSLFIWNHKYYFFGGLTEFDRLRPTVVSVFHLNANGTVNESCRIGVKGEKEAYTKFLATPGVGSLVKVIRTIGAGGEDCGTMHSGLQHDEQAAAAERRAALRPWAVSIEKDSMTAGHPYYVFDDRTKQYLEDWSLGDIWSRREYQTLFEHIKPAEDGLAAYLVKEFGVEPSKAQSDSIQVVQQLIGARFILPNEFDTSAESRNIYFGEYSIREAIISRDTAKLDAMLANPRSIKPQGQQITPEGAFKNVISNALPDAVEWPYGLNKLLKAGANPNQPNEFGKTPLMVAAHLDRPDSVRALLSAHADINAVTHTISESCSNGFDRVGRSALTYASENASPVVIKLLVDAGADQNIRDSKGNGLDFYLAKNPRLTSEEQRLGVSSLSKNIDRFVGPSFSCHAARTGIEKLICNSEVLRMFDQELALAYESFHAKQGSLAVADQRDWIKRRNESCSGVSLSEDCLAEIMRTRIRYLHNRNSENLATE